MAILIRTACPSHWEVSEARKNEENEMGTPEGEVDFSAATVRRSRHPYPREPGFGDPGKPELY